jgi:formate-dependent nitrite reductase membrane component NrfD
VIVLIYVLMMRSTAGEDAGRIAEEWLSGPKKLAFWGGLVGAGLLIPGLLYIIPTEGIGATLAPIFVLVGGLVLRFLVVYADKRTQLPGEAEYYSRLPDSDELFLKAWK